MMAKFEDLWKTSKQFRQLFLLNGVFESVNNIDLAKAEALWFCRYPNVNWDFCDVDGCTALVPKGQVCRDHIEGNPRLQRYKWASGELYRFYSKRVWVGTLRRNASEYVSFKKWQARKIWKEVPNGYSVYTADGNPFNLHRSNLILLSNIAIAAIEKKVLNIPNAALMDTILGPYIAETFSKGRPKSQWVYGFEAIAQAAGVKMERVRQAVSRRHLDPSKLESVVGFCHSCKKTDDEQG